METKSYCTVVEMPDSTLLEVEYYCNDDTINTRDKKRATKLFIQLDNCICCLQIAKQLIEDKDALERIVQNKVINERGHLC